MSRYFASSAPSSHSVGLATKERKENKKEKRGSKKCTRQLLVSLCFFGLDFVQLSGLTELLLLHDVHRTVCIIATVSVSQASEREKQKAMAAKRIYLCVLSVTLFVAGDKSLRFPLFQAHPVRK